LDLSPCLDLLFSDEDPATPTDDRIRLAAEAGLGWVEMWGWTQRDTAAIGRALRATGVRLNCLTIDPFVPLVDEGAHDEFVKSVDRSSRVAADLDCPFVVVLAGDAIPSVPRPAQHQSVVAGLRRGADIAASYGVTLILENLNSRVDHVGHFLDTTSEALDIVDEVGHPQVRMLYDLYHSAVMDEQTANVLDGRLDLVAHVQVADAPGRHEPGTGAIDWPNVLGWLSAAGYTGRLGLEYIPTVPSASSMDHLRAVIAAAS
jgi:hydroxypyruvate isomerase